MMHKDEALRRADELRDAAWAVVKDFPGMRPLDLPANPTFALRFCVVELARRLDAAEAQIEELKAKADKRVPELVARQVESLVVAELVARLDAAEARIEELTTKASAKAAAK